METDEAVLRVLLAACGEIPPEEERLTTQLGVAEAVLFDAFERTRRYRGHCYQNYWAQIGNSAPVFEAATLMLGVRDLDPAERERLERSAIRVVHWYEGEPDADVQASIDELASRVEEIYLHIDIDALDPQVEAPR